MKWLLLLAAAGMAWSLCSCKSHKTVTTSDLDATQSYIDTTKTVVDTAGRKQTNTDPCSL